MVLIKNGNNNKYNGNKYIINIYGGNNKNGNNNKYCKYIRNIYGGIT